MMELFYNLFREEEGQGMTEYGLILGAIAIVAVAATLLLTGALDGLFDTIVDQIDSIGGE